MKKRVYILYFLILMLIMGTGASWGYDKSNIPKMIRVGLNHGDKAASIVNLNSSSGFDFGYYDDRGFNILFNLIDYEDIIIRKDGYYSKQGGSYMEVSPEGIDDSMIGPYHVQVGDEFPSRNDMENFLESLANSSNYYPVYDGGWKIWTGLYVSRQGAEQFIASNKRINDKKLKVVNPNNGLVVASNKEGKVLFIYDSSQRAYNFRAFLDKGGNDIISVNGKRYRGEIIIRRYADSDMTIINRLGLDEYLYGVLPKEMSGNWPIEALKAQAVAARNYGVANINKHAEHGFDVCNSIHSQVYGGYDVEKPRCNSAVDETNGKILTYNGKIVSAFFHSNSGGHTENSENIWSLYLPYIRGVDDEFSIGAPNSTWTKIYTPAQIQNILSSNGMSIDNITNIYAKEYSENGRVLSLKIEDSSNNEITLLKEKTRALFGYYHIKSMQFDLTTDIDLFIRGIHEDSMEKKSLNRLSILSADGVSSTEPGKTYNVYNGDKYIATCGVPSKYIFTGKGWGHGLGMSQWGAKKMAELGYTYEDILKHYYTGTIIE